MSQEVADAIVDAFQRGGERGDQSLVGVVDDLAYRTQQIAEAITPQAAPGHDAAGGTVASLTEAVMGVTGGLCRIAGAIESLAEAVASADDPAMSNKAPVTRPPTAE